MNSPRHRLPFLLILLAAAIALSAAGVLKFRSVPAVSPASAKAFLNADWGMSPAEVEMANGLPLAAADTSMKLFTVEPGMEKRYSTRRSAGQKLLGREAEVYYTFLDNRLKLFHVFAIGPEPDRLDADFRSYLERAFGANANEIEDGSALRRVWHFQDKIVNYWLFEEKTDTALIAKAGFGVTHQS